MLSGAKYKIKQNKDLNRNASVPVQFPPRQFMSSVLSPEQSRPPYSGEGLEQLRNRLFCPYPHVALQEPQSFQLVQPPSTATNHWHWSCAISIQQFYEIVTQIFLILYTVLAKENMSFF